MRWVGHIYIQERTEWQKKPWMANLSEKDHLDNIKMDHKKCNTEVWIGFILFRIGANGKLP
jgi:hypothetical protein